MRLGVLQSARETPILLCWSCQLLSYIFAAKRFLPGEKARENTVRESFVPRS